MQTKLFHLQALSALHVGTGQGVGVVDLPIARAKATNLPLVPGSSIKGVLRDELQQQSKNENAKPNSKQIKTLFGPDSTVVESHAGAVAFGDAHLLILPIRSFAGTVAFATCPFILRQYQRDAASDLNIPKLGNKAGVTANSKLIVSGEIALEDLDMPITQDGDVAKWAKAIAVAIYPKDSQDANSWQTEFCQRFVVLPDDIFSFLADTATEVRTRIRIDPKTRVVIDGALWTEENLPAEAVLWGVVGVSNSKDKSKQTAQQLADLLPKKVMNIQLGGKHTVGRGLCRFMLNDTAK